MDEHWDAIPADANIGLDAARAYHYRRFKSSERIFGRYGVVTTMCDKQHNIAPAQLIKLHPTRLRGFSCAFRKL
jgi:hypothetical protein